MQYVKTRPESHYKFYLLRNFVGAGEYFICIACKCNNKHSMHVVTSCGTNPDQTMFHFTIKLLTDGNLAKQRSWQWP